MAGRSLIRVTDEGAENILLQWFEECNVTANSSDSDEVEDCAEVRSEYDSENMSDAESSISSDNVHHVVQWANAEGQRKHGDLRKHLDHEEFLRFVGLLILAGVYKSHNKEITNLWNVEDGRPIFNKTMKEENRCPDKLSPIRAFSELWLLTLQDSYIPYESLTLDKQLLTFRDMTKGFETSGRNVTTGNFFTNLDLAREMEKKNLTLLGTIRKNKPELP
ncbi:hypothetical protein ILUMI_13420 [Ignelater luminosus]|uniref:PiggyBac transposable element-derived protein domain-containing protein n=1 Tax=Ignelater luminosus TaxID=2038154 RepID=A0A8K0GC02_IGNLU|nr:hypothetical protein ILUMI_13420 [Ignelater luminosus]